MAKTEATRLQETLTYITAVNAGLSQDLAQLLNSSANSGKVMDDVSKAISLSGKTPWFGGDRANNTDTQRDALRALLLCQRAYFTSLWSPNTLPATPFILGNTWPKVTLDHWRFRPEHEICEGIRMFAVVPNIPDQALADAAAVRSDIADSVYVAKRNSASPPVGNSCFDQVSHWLLAAGFVSLRWIMKFKPAGFNYAPFGPGVVRIRSTDAMPVGPIRVARGMIVRMYTDRRPGGHFMVSDGDGWGWGFNNSSMEAGGGEGKVPNGHARCLIHRQFAEYREAADKISATDFGGKLVVLDPNALVGAC
jgi:hypothetical protein